MTAQPVITNSCHWITVPTTYRSSSKYKINSFHCASQGQGHQTVLESQIVILSK